MKLKKKFKKIIKSLIKPKEKVIQHKKGSP